MGEGGGYLQLGIQAVKTRIARHLIRKIGTCPCSCTSMYTPVGQNPMFAATCRTLRIFTSLGEKPSCKPSGIARHLIRKIGTCPCSCTSMYTPVGQNPMFAATCRTLHIFTSLGEKPSGQSENKAEFKHFPHIVGISKKNLKNKAKVS